MHGQISTTDVEPVREAHDLAKELLAEARAEAERIKLEATLSAERSIEEDRSRYRTSARKIVADAISDSKLLIAKSQEQADELVHLASAEAQRVREEAEDSIATKDADANERIASLKRLADITLEEAQQRASEIVTQATAEAEERDRVSQAEAKRVMDEAQAHTEKMRTRGQMMVKKLQKIRAESESEIAAAKAHATQAAAASARQTVDAQLIDTRREMQMLDHEIATKREQAEIETRRLLADAEAQAETILLQAASRAATTHRAAIVETDRPAPQVASTKDESLAVRHVDT